MRKLHLIILAIVLILIVISVSIVLIISNNKSKQVSMDNVQNIEEFTDNQEATQENTETEYMDINDL